MLLQPVSRFGRWVGSWVVPGLGMFNEAYYIFSVGNLKPLWQEQYPECWKEGRGGCSTSFLNLLDYTQVAGLIVGMLAMGAAVDRLGRKWSSVVTSALMFVSGALLTGAAAPSAHSLFLWLTLVQAVFGFAVGGEFPVAAASASERAEGSASLARRRGETVVLVFSMQAWGTLLSIIIPLAALAAQGQAAAPPYSPRALSVAWRLTYGLGLLPICYMVYHRVFKLKESTVWEEKRRARKGAVGVPADPAAAAHSRRAELVLLLRHYWPRLLGTSLGWFAWDFYYYGQKIFQDTFISVIVPGVNVVGLLEYSLLNSSVAAFGYYFAAFTIDKPWMGRRRMQANGFMWLCGIFVICAALFDQLLASRGGLRTFQALYYLASFWGQWGPNATTFLVASELYPTEVRGMAHGISAAFGKVGALTATIIMSSASDRAKFWLSGGAGALGVVVTLAFIPEMGGLGLAAGDERWAALRAGNGRAYHGEAVNPCHLSWTERAMGLGRQYRPPQAAPPAAAAQDDACAPALPAAA